MDEKAETNECVATMEGKRYVDQAGEAKMGAKED